MKQKMLPVLLFIILTAVMFYPVFLKGRIPFPGDLLLAEYQPWKSYSYNGIAPGGIPHKAQYFDALRQMYPWQSLVTSIIQKKQFPLWNPYNFSGTPLFANIQSSVLFPPKLLYFILPQHIAWTILVILQPFLSMLFMYWFVRTVGCSKKGAIISAVSYAFCLFASTFLQYNTINHILYLLPLSLVCIEHLKNRFRISYALFLVISVSMGVFAGHIQVWSGFIAFLLLYTAIRLISDSTNSKRVQLFFEVVLPVLFGIGISAVQFLPTFELILQSARTNQPYNFLIEHLLLQPYQLILYLIPDLFGNPANRNYLLSDSYPAKSLYIGLVPFIFALCTVWSVKRNEIIKTFWLLFIIIGLCIVRSPISGLFYRIPIPFVSTSSPSNYIFLLSASLSVLAGFGIDAIYKKNNAFVMRILMTLFSVFILTFLIAKQQHFAISIKNYIFSFGLFLIACTLLFIRLHVPKVRTACLVMLFLLTFADLFYFFHKFNPFVPASYLYPNNSFTMWLTQKPGYDRVWGYGGAGLQENIASQLRYYSSEGYDPLYPKRYGQLIQSSKNGAIVTEFTNQTRSDAVIHPGWGQTDMATNPYRLKILALTATKYIFTRIEDPISEQTFPIASFELIDEFDGWRIFRYKQALPRTFVTNRYEIYASNDQFQQKFYNPTFDPKTTILLEEKPDISVSDIPLASTATIENVNNNTITITAVSNQPALLFLSDTYYPGWNAYVDGVRTKIYLAYYAFRAVAIPEGEHQVEFRYEPASFLLGLKISTACTMLVLVYLFLKKTHAK
jgi:hypothetical protein